MDLDLLCKYLAQIQLLRKVQLLAGATSVQSFTLWQQAAIEITR